MKYEVIIVGGGPAGMSAANLLARARRTVLLLDSGTGRNAPVESIHLLVSRDGVDPGKFREQAHQQLARYTDLHIAAGSAVDISGRQGDFTVRTHEGARYRGNRVLLATGLSDDLPQIDGLQHKWGKSAFLCPYCDGWEVRDRPLSVFVTAQKELPFAMMMTRWSPQVTVLTCGDLDLGKRDRGILDSLGAVVEERPVVGVTGPGGSMESVVLDDGQELASSAMFLHTKTKQRSDLPRQLGCTLLEDGCVEVDHANKTSVPGVYAAGDMARPVYQPVPIAYVAAAANDGLVAAGFIDADLFGSSFQQ